MMRWRGNRGCQRRNGSPSTRSTEAGYGQLHGWLQDQFQERTVEPNSGLGQAISYLLKHWHKLTLFLEKAGVPLDNNIATAVIGSDDDCTNPLRGTSVVTTVLHTNG